jgi:hypothetical protein
VNNGVVSNGYIITDGSRGFLISGMNDGSVLNVGIIANGDGVNVPTNYGIEPNSSVIAHGNITNQRCVFGKPAVFTV